MSTSVKEDIAFLSWLGEKGLKTRELYWMGFICEIYMTVAFEKVGENA
jgi:hypothetical protein